MSAAIEQKFGKMRTFFWPFRRKELIKFLPLVFLYAFIVFNYSLLKSTKDALLITAPNSGAEAIPFIKVWAILPMALFVTYIFTRLYNKYSQEKVFYIMMGSFLGFFFLFATVLYPLREVLHPYAFADRLQASLPKGFSGLICLIRHWSFTLFYTMAELWGTTIMAVLFWGFANEVTSVKDAKKHYAIYGVAANLATICAGQFPQFLSKDLSFFSPLLGQEHWGQALGLTTIAVLSIGLISIALFRWYNQKILKSDSFYKKSNGGLHNSKSDIKMSLRKNFSYLAKSKYLICIALIVLAFNIAINMVEIIWKDQIKLIYPNPIYYNAYMGKVLIATGIISTFIGLFVTRGMIRKFGWTVSALITPLILLITGVLFFACLLFKETKLISLAAFFSTTPIFLALLFGTLQNTFSRACKFTLFDATKEISFIPMSSECKLKGKAAIDGVGSRLGKSGGSIIHQGLLMIFGSITMITPYVGGILFLIIIGWMFSIRSLGRRFNQLTMQHEKINILEEDAPLLEEVTKQATI